jgi:hypothetical protein
MRSIRWYCTGCNSGARIVPAGNSTPAPDPDAFPQHALPAATPSTPVSGDFYTPITVPYTSTSCPTTIQPDATGEYLLPDVATGPDGNTCDCNCESARQGMVCDAVDGGEVGAILQDKLERSLSDSGDAEFSADAPRVRCNVHASVLAALVALLTVFVM